MSVKKVLFVILAMLCMAIIACPPSVKTRQKETTSPDGTGGGTGGGGTGGGGNSAMFTSKAPDGSTCTVQTGLSTNTGNTAIAAGADHNLWIINEQLYSWGGNSDQQLGRTLVAQAGQATPQQDSTPGIVAHPQSNSSPWLGVAAGAYYSIAWKKDGTVWSWGRNNKNQLGHSTPANIATETIKQITALNGETIKVVTEVSHAFALTEDKDIYGWGYNPHDQLVKHTSNSYYDKKIADVHFIIDTHNVIDIAVGAEHSLGLTNDGRVLGVGRNNTGQLGVLQNGRQQDGTIITGATPREIACNVKKIAAGHDTSFAIDNNGKLWGWGSNVNGLLAQDSSALPNSNTPQQITVTSVTKWKDVVAGASYALAIDEKDNLWIWGKDGNAISKGKKNYAPQQIGTGKTWKAIAAGHNNILALDDNDELWTLSSTNSTFTKITKPQSSSP